MGDNMKEIITLYQNLKRVWESKPPNLVKSGELLTKLKIALTQVQFLPTNEVQVEQHVLLIARDILEIGALWSIASKDIPSFERYMAQLKCYYMDYKNNLPESPYKFQLLGLNLLCLLSQNRLAEFHTELERLPVKEIQNNIYIKHPVSMEQYLMEGSYNKVFLARRNVPADNYNFFIDISLNTIRDEIAGCIEKAYNRIGLNEAARMLFFESSKLMKEYAAKVKLAEDLLERKTHEQQLSLLVKAGHKIEKLYKLNSQLNQRQWKLGNDFFYFTQEAKYADHNIPAKLLAQQTIEYAKELEMIV